MEIRAFEAQNKLGMLLDRVELGEEIIITRHGKPVARLVPNILRIEKVQARAALARIRTRSANWNIESDWEAIKADRESGRP